MEPLYPPGFEECDRLRSAFIRDLTFRQIRSSAEVEGPVINTSAIPRRLVRYWHDPFDLPEDVGACLDSWDRLKDHGFDFCMFDDTSAATYIAEAYGEHECRAFARCSHPAMRCDYFRLCFILAEGGLYVDADDVLLSDNWIQLFRGDRLKVQPLAYDILAGRMLPAEEIWKAELPTDGRVFYVNNDPIAAPANHPVLRHALTRATSKLLEIDRFPDIQSTTGPGNLTAALAAHARDTDLAALPCDFELLRNWDSIAETRWDLSYRSDDRNWRNVFAH